MISRSNYTSNNGITELIKHKCGIDERYCQDRKIFLFNFIQNEKETYLIDKTVLPKVRTICIMVFHISIRVLIYQNYYYYGIYSNIDHRWRLTVGWNLKKFCNFFLKVNNQKKTNRLYLIHKTGGHKWGRQGTAPPLKSDF